MDCITLGFRVLHHLLEIAQTHVHWVGDAIQPSHPLSSPSLPNFNLSQHQAVFKWVSSLHHVAKILVSTSASVLPMNIQDWFPLGWTGLISLQSKGFSRVFSNTTIQKHHVIKGNMFIMMLLNCGVGEDSWESLGLQGDPTSPFWRRSALGFLWKEWC